MRSLLRPSQFEQIHCPRCKEIHSQPAQLEPLNDVIWFQSTTSDRIINSVGCLATTGALNASAYLHGKVVDKALPACGALQKVVHAGLDRIFGMDVMGTRVVRQTILQHFVVCFIRLRRQVPGVDRLRVRGCGREFHVHVFWQNGGYTVARQGFLLGCGFRETPLAWFRSQHAFCRGHFRVLPFLHVDLAKTGGHRDRGSACERSRIPHPTPAKMNTTGVMSEGNVVSSVLSISRGDLWMF